MHWQFNSYCNLHSAFVLLQGSATLSMAYAGTKFISSVSTMQSVSDNTFFSFTCKHVNLGPVYKERGLPYQAG